MNIELVQGGILGAILIGSVWSAIRSSEENHTKMKDKLTHPTDEDVVVGDLGPAIEEVKGPSLVETIIEKSQIKQTAEGLIEKIDGINLSLIPPGLTRSGMAEFIRNMQEKSGIKMTYKYCLGVAAKVVQLREEGKAVEPAVDAANDPVKGKTNINAA